MSRGIAAEEEVDDHAGRRDVQPDRKRDPGDAAMPVEALAPSVEDGRERERDGRDREEHVAREHGAVGWKVNGAGGEGGSITILCGPEGEKKRALIEALPALDERFQVIPTYLSRIGLRRWEVPA